MIIYNNSIVKITLFSTIYVIVLIFLSPIVDHLFTSLDEDKAKQENNLQILFEIITHSMVLVILWYLLAKYFKKFLENLLDIKMKDITETAMEIISGIILVGLQNNLIQKLSYITYEHPFRLVDVYG